MAININNCEVVVNDSKLLASTISISQKNNLKPIKSIGYRNPLSNSPDGGVENRFNLNYILETHNEPNFLTCRKLNEYIDTNSYSVINIGGLICTGYLNSYSISIKEGQPVQATADFIVFQELPSEMLEQSATGHLGYDTSAGQKIGHYLSTAISNIDETEIGQIINLDYECQMDWEPIYKIGQTYPAQVIFKGGSQNFKFLSEIYKNIQFSGQLTQSDANFYKASAIKISNLSSLWDSSPNNTISLYPYDGDIVSQQTSISEGQVITHNTEIVKNF